LAIVLSVLLRVMQLLSTPLVSSNFSYLKLSHILLVKGSNKINNKTKISHCLNNSKIQYQNLTKRQNRYR